MGILGNLVGLETLFAACIMQLLCRAGYAPHTKAVSMDCCCEYVSASIQGNTGRVWNWAAQQCCTIVPTSLVGNVCHG